MHPSDIYFQGKRIRITWKVCFQVMGLLIQAGASINSQDLDGWTPLHAAAHWAQREACEILCDKFCNMDIKNHVGQTAFDVADPDVLELLEQLQKKQATLQKERCVKQILKNFFQKT